MLSIIRRITPFVKRDDGLRLVWCEAVVPGGDGDEYLGPDDVRAAAMAFMDGLARGEYSWPDGLGAAQSFIARRGDPEFTPGAWVIAMECLSDEAWNAVRDGQIDACEVEVRLESVEPVMYTDGGSSPVQKHQPGRHDQKTHGRRAAAVRVAAAKKLDQAKETEPQVTADLQAIVAETGGQLVGLDFRLKTQESLERKVRQELERHTDYGIADAVGKMRDGLRYTVATEDASLAGTLVKVNTALKATGYEAMPERFKNSWGEEGYQGIHTNWKAPNGTVFEVQFHTPKSYAVKESESHPLYEKQRVANTFTEIETLRQQINELWTSVPIPPGVIGMTAEQAGL